MHHINHEHNFELSFIYHLMQTSSYFINRGSGVIYFLSIEIEKVIIGNRETELRKHSLSQLVIVAKR